MTANLPLRAPVRPTRVALAGLAVAATLLVAGCGDDGSSTADDPATSGPSSTAPTDGAGTGGSDASSSPAGGSSTASSGSSESGGSSTGQTSVDYYFIGSTPQGPKLFLEPHDAPTDPSAALQLVSLTPDDPDYRTLWSAGALDTASVADGQIDVTLDTATLEQRPAGMSAVEARLSVQQVVLAMQSATGQQLPVRFMVGDAPAPTVLGVPTSDPVAAADALEVLSPVDVTSPTEGDTFSGTLDAQGVAISFEGTVPWQVLDSNGKQVLKGAAQGTFDPSKLTPWQASIDISALPSGTYTFVAMTDDPSGGEGGGPTKDTKTFSVL